MTKHVSGPRLNISAKQACKHVNTLRVCAEFAAGEWEACGDRFYERHELYTMSWSNVRLDQMRQASAGPPCALSLVLCVICFRHVSQLKPYTVSSTACASRGVLILLDLSGQSWVQLHHQHARDNGQELCCVLSSCATGADGCRVACARYGGPIAMVRDDRKLVVIQGATTKPVVRIFTAAGEALAAFMWDHSRIVGMGWSNQEDLLIIEDKGEVRMRLPPAHANRSRLCVDPLRLADQVLRISVHLSKADPWRL